MVVVGVVVFMVVLGVVLLRSSEGGLFRSGLFMVKSDIVLGGFFVVVVVLVVEMELVVGCVVKLVS